MACFIAQNTEQTLDLEARRELRIPTSFATSDLLTQLACNRTMGNKTSDKDALGRDGTLDYCSLHSVVYQMSPLLVW